jgi:hypothetical protein
MTPGPYINDELRAHARVLYRTIDVRVNSKTNRDLQLFQKLIMMRTKRYFALSTISSSSPGGRREEEWIPT